MIIRSDKVVLPVTASALRSGGFGAPQLQCSTTVD